MSTALLSTLVSTSLSWLTVFGQIIILILFISLVTKKTDNKFITFFAKHGFLFSLFVVFVAMVGSLTYSDILMIEPCKLCWYQRIFMYPQVAILGIGYLVKDYRATFYALILSILGAPIALFHYLLQRGIVKAGCSVVGNYSVSCAKYFKLNLGYITIPLMAFTAFALVILLLILYRKRVS